MHNGATVSTGSGSFAGSLSERAQRTGAAIGLRYVQGPVWQFLVGADVGLSLQSHSSVDHFDVSGAGARNYRLGLVDTTQLAALVAPSVGLRWVGDRFSFGLEPRFELLAGPSTSWSVVVPLTVAWSWFL